MLAGHEIFYNYFYSDIIHQVPLNLMKDRQVAFSSIDLLNFEDSQNFFELLLGST